MINGRDNLREAAFAEHFDHLEPVENLVLRLQNVVALFIICVCDCVGNTRASWDLLCIIYSVIGQLQLSELFSLLLGQHTLECGNKVFSS